MAKQLTHLEYHKIATWVTENKSKLDGKSLKHGVGEVLEALNIVPSVYSLKGIYKDCGIVYARKQGTQIKTESAKKNRTRTLGAVVRRIAKAAGYFDDGQNQEDLRLLNIIVGNKSMDEVDQKEGE